MESLIRFARYQINRKVKNHLVCLFLILAGLAGKVDAQIISVYAGRSTSLYDGRFYPALFGEKVVPSFLTLDARVGWADYSASPFASICKHPEVGVGFQFDGLGSVKAVNGPGMGNIYSLYGYIDRPVLKWGGFSLGYSAELGLGFMFNRRYDPVKNPWNVLISAPVNAHISLGVQAQYAFLSRYDVGLGFFSTTIPTGLSPSRIMASIPSSWPCALE